MSTDTTYTFSGALTLKRVQTRSAAASVSSLKISPAPHELLAVGDTKGVLTIHRLNKNLEIFRKKMVGHGRQLIAIRALTWNPQYSNELYVGFANGDVISYRLRLDVDDTDYEDPSSPLMFEGPIHDLVVAPSGAELFVLFGTSVAVVRQGNRTPSTIPIPPDSRPTRLIFDATCVIVIFMVAEPGVSPAAIAYDLRSHEVRWRLFTSCDDMILAGAISHDHQHSKITILHATKGAETYTIPNLDHVSTVFPGRRFPSAVDISYVDRDTFVCGSSTGGLLFANGISGQTSEISATVRATYMLARLDVARLGGRYTLVVTSDGNLLSPFCDVLHFTETMLPRSRSRSIWTYSALALLAAMSIIYLQASYGSAISMSNLSSTVFGSPESNALVLSSPELPLPESPSGLGPSASAELESSAESPSESPSESPLSPSDEGSPSSDALSSSPISSSDLLSSTALDLPPPNLPASAPSSDALPSSPISSSDLLSSTALDLPPPNLPASASEPSSQVQGSHTSIRSSDHQPAEPGPSPVHETESEQGSLPPSISDSGHALDNPEYTQLPLAPSVGHQHFGQVSPPHGDGVPPNHAASPVTINTLAPAATVTIIRDAQTEKAGIGSIGGLVFGAILGITVTLVSMAFVYNYAAVFDWFAGYFSTTPKPPIQPTSSTSNFQPPSTSSAEATTSSAEAKDE